MPKPRAPLVLLLALKRQAYTRAGEERRAALIWKIAREPKAIWIGVGR